MKMPARIKVLDYTRFGSTHASREGKSAIHHHARHVSNWRNLSNLGHLRGGAVVGWGGAPETQRTPAELAYATLLATHAAILSIGIWVARAGGKGRVGPLALQLEAFPVGHRHEREREPPSALVGDLEAGAVVPVG